MMAIASVDGKEADGIDGKGRWQTDGNDGNDGKEMAIMVIMARVDGKEMAMMTMARVDPPTVTGRLLAAGGRLILRRPRTPHHLWCHHNHHPSLSSLSAPS